MRIAAAVGALKRFARGVPRSAATARTTIDFWGKPVDVETRTGRAPLRLDEPTRARETFLELNALYQAVVASEFAGTADHHVQNEPNYHVVHEQFRASGIPIEDYTCDAAAFESFLERSLPVYREVGYAQEQGELGGYFPQKAFEHWISAEYLGWRPTDRVLDFAAWTSPAIRVLAAHRPAEFWKHDITLKTNPAAREISGFSDAVECESEFFDFITAHCAIDNFEADYDTKFFREAHRLLKPGGKILVTPLHMSAVFENLVALGSPGIEVDPGARIVVGAPASLRFARLYDVAALRRRVVDAASGLRFHLVHVRGLPLDRHPTTSTNRFMLIGTKPAR